RFTPTPPPASSPLPLHDALPIYCYWDGALLAGHAADGARIPPGARPFPSQFVFPSGLACRNFDQLATACMQNWQESINLLKQGRSEEHTSELQSLTNLVFRLLLS